MIKQELLDKFINGDCTPSESDKVVQWLTDPGNREQVRDIMQKHWNREIGGADHNWNLLLAKTKDRIFEKGVSHGQVINTRSRKMPRLLIAATWVFLTLASIAVTLLLLRNNNTWQDHSDLLVRATEKIESSSGQIILKVLPDGTKVWLNSQSRLSYPPDFGETRTVELTGEAFFDVTEDKEHPFIVKAGEIKIRVLGTAFNIKSYPGDKTIATTLVRGKVVIERDDKQHEVGENLELEPNQQAVFSLVSETLTVTQVDAEKFTSWTDGKLVFRDAPVHDVLRSLERWYGVTIHTDDTDMSCALTAQIDREPLEKTLELLRSITGMKYRISGDEVFIEGKVCGQ